MKQPPRPSLRQRLQDALSRRSRAVIILYVVLRVFVAASMVYSAVRGNYESAFVCALVLALFILPAFLERKLNIDLPNTLEVVILLFIFAAEILGELGHYYLTYPHWDTMLHTTCGFLTAAVGFSLIDILNRDGKIKFNLSPVYCAVAAFCFSMTIGVFWEFWEFAIDQLLHTDMQKDTVVAAFASTYLDPTQSNVAVRMAGIQDTAVNGQSLGVSGYLDIGLYDTMEDLFVNFLGALVFSVIGYFYIKHRGKGRIASQFIPTYTAPTLEGSPEAPPENTSEKP